MLLLPVPGLRFFIVSHSWLAEPRAEVGGAQLASATPLLRYLRTLEMVA